jgi:hypothetical protein
MGYCSRFDAKQLKEIEARQRGKEEPPKERIEAGFIRQTGLGLWKKLGTKKLGDVHDR